MISSTHPAFAKLGPKLERAHRELETLEAFLARDGAMAQDRVAA